MAKSRALPAARPTRTPLPFVELRAVRTRVRSRGMEKLRVNYRSAGLDRKQLRWPRTADKWTKKGGFRTGDVVTSIRKDTFKITDRLKDLIKSGGSGSARST